MAAITDTPDLSSNITAALAAFNATLSSLPPSFTSSLYTSSPDDIDLFFQCWIRPHCPACLSPSNPYPCSWCATSQTCVPNTIYAYPFGILSPIKSADICPLGWRERWEMRARPFSCRCSSMTFLSVVVAVLGTLLAMVLIWASVRVGFWIGRRWRRWWKAGRNWWIRGGKGAKDASTDTEAVDESGRHEDGAGEAAPSERTPLLA